MNEFIYLQPELWLIFITLFGLIAGVIAGGETITYLCTQLGFIGALFWDLNLTLIPLPTEPLFHNMFQLSLLSIFLKSMIYMLASLSMALSRFYLKRRDLPQHEFYMLALLSVIGMSFLVSSNNLLMLYLGLEVLALPLYAMVAMRRHSSLAVEAGMKYFVMGALTSGMLLWGISVLYGITGTLDFAQMALRISALTPAYYQTAVFAMAFVLIGVAFKFGAVPFHMWLPDVYEGSLTSMTLFVASVPKIAGLGMALLIFDHIFPVMSGEWQPLCMGLGLLSLVVGNIVAVVQTNVRRLLAYSAIAHVGFIFLGLMVGEDISFAPVTFYTVVYAITSVGAFGVLVLLSGEVGEVETLKDLSGLNVRRPWIALMMLLFMFSLAGVPPLGGFYAKFLIISALVDAGHVALAAVAIFFSVIGAFYYLRVVKTMYFDEPALPFEQRTALDGRVVVLSMGGLVTLIGLFPMPLWRVITQLFLPV